jgi:hypothetical protein
VRVDLWSRAPITVPGVVLTQLRLWYNDPSSFFVVKSAASLSNDPFTRLFRLLYNTTGGDETIKLIRLRLGQIGLFRLRTRLGRCQLHQGTDLEKEFLSRIQLEQGAEELDRATKWASTGGKYDVMSEAFGGLGSIICLPLDISSAK